MMVFLVGTDLGLFHIHLFRLGSIWKEVLKSNARKAAEEGL